MMMMFIIGFALGLIVSGVGFLMMLVYGPWKDVE